MKVLLADDSVLILERLQEMLSVYREVEIVGSFENGIDTLDALRTLQPDLAIIYIRMPELSGLDIFTQFRKENKSITFIILTLYSSDYFKRMTIKAGSDYFFNKIDDFERVSEVVAELLAKENSRYIETAAC